MNEKISAALKTCTFNSIDEDIKFYRNRNFVVNSLQRVVLSKINRMNFSWGNSTREKITITNFDILEFFESDSIEYYVTYYNLGNVTLLPIGEFDAEERIILLSSSGEIYISVDAGGFLYGGHDFFDFLEKLFSGQHFSQIEK